MPADGIRKRGAGGGPVAAAPLAAGRALGGKDGREPAEDAATAGGWAPRRVARLRLVAAADAESRLGIALFTEEGKTSGFLQALDQYNAKWHSVYGKGRDEYMLTYESVYGEPLESIGIPDTIISANCRE